MSRTITMAALLAGFALPAAAEDETRPQQTRPEAAGTSSHELSAGVAGLSGMLVGRLVSKDVEKGTFVLQVDAVPRIWRNNKAERPKSIIGKTVEIEGVFGK